MDEYFTHKCVTSDAPSQPPQQSSSSSSVSTWSQCARCEFVVVQENQGAHGASRAVLASIVNMTLQSRKTSDVLLFTLDSALLASTIQPSEKLAHVDYSSDASLFYASLLQSASHATDETVNSKQLLTRLQGDITDKLDACAKRQNGSLPSARPVVVVLDSLNVLLEQSPLKKVLLFLRALRQNPQIGSVIVRFSAATEPKATRQVLTSESTAVALVETRSSLNAYPILAKERRREIPKEMHGFVLLLRQKKNGRSSESVDYFQIDGNRMLFFTAAPAETKKKQTTTSADDEVSKNNTSKAGSSSESQSSRVSLEPGNHSSSSNASAPASSSSSHQAALPVRQGEVSFNLSISVEEQLAKSKVQLPYMHQGQSSSSSSSTMQSSSTSSTGNSSNTNLFFIDDDDPDWDDDDLDDDLDI